MARATQTISKSKFEQFQRSAAPGEELQAGNGLIYRQGSRGGSWVFRYSQKLPGDAKPKRRKISVGDASLSPADAMAIALELGTQVRNGDDPALKREIRKAELQQTHQTVKGSPHRNLGRFFEEIYTPHIKGISEVSREQLGMIRREFGHLFDRDMATLQAADIRAWEAKRKVQIQRATMQRGYGAFKAMLNYAANVKKDDPNDSPVLSENPLRNVMLSRATPAERQQSKEQQEELNLKRDLLDAQQRKAVAVGLQEFGLKVIEGRKNSRAHGKAHLADLEGLTYPHWFIPFCHIARLTGMRPGDIRRLRWQDIKPDFRTKREVLSYRPHKTSHHRDPVVVNFPIGGELKTLLNAWRVQQGQPKEGLLFPSERKVGAEMDKHAYQRHWQKVKELGGVRDDVQFYCFRHNFISDLVNSNASLLKVARLVGHKDTAMIARHYYREDLDDMADLVDGVQSAWGGSV